ncbi:MAG TPA: excinuclease ABC subunit UvrC [Geobacteraceae bacterium]
MITVDKIERFPSAPGVYIMKGEDGVVLYVGKARELKKRVRSYFSASRDSRWQIRFLMERVADIEFIVTDTEKEALILENTLIKKYRPRYNFNLRDDKTYFSLRMDMREEFPRLTIIRKVVRDGARYFGPYSSASAAREVLKELAKLFPLRHYPLETCRRRKRPCLFYQLRQCSAPCHGLISREDYAALAEGAALFLEGKSRELVKIYRQRMAEAAAAERYEEAGRFRDLLRAIEQTVEKQKVVTGGGDRDILGFERRGEHLELALLFMRGGTVIGSRTYSLTWELDDAEGVASFLHEYYGRDVYVPEELLLPITLDEAGAFAELLAEKRGSRVAISCPHRGTKKELVELAMKNAATSAVEKSSTAFGAEATLRELQQRLHLQHLPRRIECYDISNIQGQFAVGSRVVFRDALPAKDLYRRYRIRTVGQADDFAMMHEVLSRRFRPGEEDDRPDLIVVDGGIGQLNILCRVLEELNVEGVAAASLAKSRVRKGMMETEVRRTDERVFLPGRKNPVVLRQNSPPLLLLARIRDEAHRFAITYHKKLRGKSALASSLDEVPGIGPRRKKALLRHFGSLKGVGKASREELVQVDGISGELADAIWRELHGEENDG